MDLLEILKRPEGKTLEFKRDLSSPDGALKTIVAFANTAGGTLLVGVEDRSRHVRGVPDALDLEERLANLVSDRITPRIVPEHRRSCSAPWMRCRPSRSIRARALRTTASARDPSPASPIGGCPIAAPTPSSSRNCAASRGVKGSTNSPCRGWTRKHSTSERLPSRSRLSARSLGATWRRCAL